MRNPMASPIELEVGGIRELSKGGRHPEALVAAEVLAVAAPQDRDLLYLIAANQRCLNRIHEALETLRRLEQLHPRFSLLYQERGYCYMTLRDAPRAIDAFLRGVDINPALAASWSMLERLYRVTGDVGNAANAAERVSALKHLPPEVVQAGSLFSDGELSAAENILRAYLLESRDHLTGAGAPPPARTHADASPRSPRPRLGMAAGARLLHLRWGPTPSANSR